MKKEEIFEYLSQQENDYAGKADPAYLRIMTSNVLLTIEPKSKLFELNYEERADILAGMYLYYQPDSIGLQEVGRDMELALKERLGDTYSFANTPLGDRVNWCYHGIPLIQNFTPVIYNKQLYEEVDGRYHLFHGDTGQCWSYHWVWLRSRSDPKRQYVHMNLHHLPGNDDERRPGVVDVRNELVHLRRHFPRVPIFVTGDYNFQYTDRLYEEMVQGLEMQSGMLVAEDIEPNGRDYWCHLLGSTELQKNGSAIDHITVTTDLVNVKVHRVLYNELLCKSSDHCSRFLDVELKKS